MFKICARFCCRKTEPEPAQLAPVGVQHEDEDDAGIDDNLEIEPEPIVLQPAFANRNLIVDGPAVLNLDARNNLGNIENGESLFLPLSRWSDPLKVKKF